MAIEVGLFLPVGPSADDPTDYISTLTAQLDRLNGQVDSIWMSDHFMWGQNPVHEAWTLISYLASEFKTLDIGTLVLGQGYRNPALLAKMASTLQILSGGRLILGLGAGWKEDEYHAYGYLGKLPPAGVRVAQLEEASIIIKRLLYDVDPISYYGRYYRIVDAVCQPKPKHFLPLMIGGGGQKTIRIVAQHANWWNYTAPNPSAYREKIRLLYENCAYLGRNPEEIRLTWFGKIAVGVTEADSKKRDRYNDAKLVGTPAQIVDQIAAYVELGVDYFMFEVEDENNPDVLEMLSKEVIPQIKAL